jgi:hypothetical protein
MNMDHQNFAQLLGNYGEFFGAVAVVVTLAYLAGQLRQNTKALRASSYSNWNQVVSSWSHFYAQYSSEFTAIEQRTDVSELTPDELKILDAAAYLACTQAETAFLQYRAGALDGDVFESRMRSYTTFVAGNSVLSQLWLETLRRYGLPEFVESIEKRGWQE